MFAKCEAVMPGFINITLSNRFLSETLAKMAAEEKLGVTISTPKKIVIDYGGPNVAKPLHVGHLRSAIIVPHIKMYIQVIIVFPQIGKGNIHDMLFADGFNNRRTA